MGMQMRCMILKSMQWIWKSTCYVYKPYVFVGDSLALNNGKKFSTKDQDHDSTSGSCDKTLHTGWWFTACYHANPNGMYRKTAVKTTQRVNWYHFGNELCALTKKD